MLTRLVFVLSMAPVPLAAQVIQLAPADTLDAVIRYENPDPEYAPTRCMALFRAFASHAPKNVVGPAEQTNINEIVAVLSAHAVATSGGKAGVVNAQAAKYETFYQARMEAVTAAGGDILGDDPVARSDFIECNFVAGKAAQAGSTK